MGLLIVISLTAASLRAQEVPLTLNDALDAAIQSNSDVAIASLEEQSAREKFRQTNAVFLPQIRLSYSAMTTNNPLNAFGFKLQQQSITQNDFNPELLNSPSATQNFMTKAEWQQPIINFDLISVRQAARAGQDVYAFKTKRTKQYLMFEVQWSYAQLQLAHHAAKVLEANLQSIKSIFDYTNKRFEQGYLQKSDVLLVEVQLTTTENKLAEARSNVRNASDYLSLLMGAKPGAVYVVDSTVVMNTPREGELSLPSNRADFLAMNAAIEGQNKMIRSGKSSYLPKLNAFGEYMINDGDAFGFGSDSYLAGLQLSWTIFNGTATRHKVTEQEIEKTKTQRQLSQLKEQAQLELNKTRRQLNDAAFAVQQQAIAVSQATEAHRILKNRYQQGLVTTTDLLQAEALLSQQKLGQAQAIFQYNTTIAYLEFLTSTTEQ